LGLDYKKDNSYSQVGTVPKTKSIRSVALYDARDGTIFHMHHVMTMEGCNPQSHKDVEHDAISFAKKLGHSTDNLKILHAPDYVNPFTKYRIDLSNLRFVEISVPSSTRIANADGS
jgi:hypothetical protein